ncbi:non-homologous end joining protein Ku [Streptomyces himalayensis]|uniref:Non-homologous end joining protein Ku n=1 Tax=Streptomyces himalayensis subsp. himalayensis TaxID=2756131 RepID=A0A7W0DP68_9ACTN|nr:Ku protein [Streptomyces himalayensis]MBA2948208.1 Ku protein [Streptomyces himalayensis subsp. himalayensis]
MARAIWSGVLSFGLVTVPVSLYTAIEDHTTHFRLLQRGTSDRVRNKRVNERTGKEVRFEDIAKGYPLGDEEEDAEYVVVEREELDRIAPGKSQLVEISGFVDLDDVEPVYFDRTYYLGPRGKEYAKVYQLLRTALEKSNRAGIATFVMRSKQYLTAVRAQPDVLVLQTMHWADEIRDPHETVPGLPESVDLSGKEVDMALRLMDGLAVDWNPEDYRDTYEEKVAELVEAKRQGEEIAVAEEPPEATNVVDLMQVLQASIDRAGEKAGGKRRKKTARGTPSAAKKSKPEPEPEKDLRNLKKEELYERATEIGVPGRSRMNREELIDALSKATRRKKAA